MYWIRLFCVSAGVCAEWYPLMYHIHLFMTKTDNFLCIPICQLVEKFSSSTPNDLHQCLFPCHNCGGSISMKNNIRLYKYNFLKMSSISDSGYHTQSYKVLVASIIIPWAVTIKVLLLLDFLKPPHIVYFFLREDKPFQFEEEYDTETPLSSFDNNYPDSSEESNNENEADIVGVIVFKDTTDSGLYLKINGTSQAIQLMTDMLGEADGTFVNHAHSLMLTLNVYWLKLFEGRTYTGGALYLLISNFPKEDQMRPENIILVDVMSDCYGGIAVETTKFPDDTTVYTTIMYVASEIHAARNTAGFIEHVIKINYFGCDNENWASRTEETISIYDNMWFCTDSDVERENLEKQNGMQFSELHRLYDC
ncbi:hypothetical protein PHYBLDRAFT_69637 [Phycomyces blakesleeanus NRRL 1555(-)]|uniref:Uncharacterized protein n=1 Tax=Phycomyces blakesleeanus (strain ATCC 8743b / DSM 1359 / FGSC 10004 / NBRC 33097 / NRRL 1555) TaxID=763407 RepID=A0A167PRY5_PHYB8|nr:hypothetical protein PHYBLDRAFT_69637 [Phycomyces blakesleeanus NRRL 1555(-)]OAD78426.1 hypothetical protein PHYBLDRAFT_69637 [Phycomyces blakesleeanus NRRL 1555(-)]|eukprot:XP_018296466.1 hypothetical protein PHYBLDRAFT_69637 [Phycomyces blakesleeanus NRRL 1555(-)]